MFWWEPISKCNATGPHRTCCSSGGRVVVLRSVVQSLTPATSVSEFSSGKILNPKGIGISVWVYVCSHLLGGTLYGSLCHQCNVKYCEALSEVRTLKVLYQCPIKSIQDFFTEISMSLNKSIWTFLVVTMLDSCLPAVVFFSHRRWKCSTFPNDILLTSVFLSLHENV